jgi:hypothetical protein
MDDACYLEFYLRGLDRRSDLQGKRSGIIELSTG